MFFPRPVSSSRTCPLQFAVVETIVTLLRLWFPHGFTFCSAARVTDRHFPPLFPNPRLPRTSRTDGLSATTLVVSVSSAASSGTSGPQHRRVVFRCAQMHTHAQPHAQAHAHPMLFTRTGTLTFGVSLPFVVLPPSVAMCK